MGPRPATLPKDDRLDLASVGKCRSDPARLRAQNRQRGRGRHSLDIARDLQRPLTIDETVRPLQPLPYVPCFASARPMACDRGTVPPLDLNLLTVYVPFTWARLQ